MGLFDFFSKPGPEEIEKKGDAFFSSEAFGPAKLEYEKALARHQKKQAADAGGQVRIKEKIKKTCEALALMHRKRGEDLVEADCLKEAEDAFFLALSLTDNKGTKQEIQQRIDETKKAVFDEKQILEETGQEEGEAGYFSDKFSFETKGPEDEQEIFTALCHSMTGEEQQAYQEYGEAFVKGFVALNNGDFKSASGYLSRAFEENAPDTGYIPLELATCYMNLGELDRAEGLLKEFLHDFPESFKAYQLFCDLLWGQQAFQAVDDLLATCPDDISKTLFISLLKGENLLQAGKADLAVLFFHELINEKGRDASLLEFLAKAYSQAGDQENALELYRELINSCFSKGVLPGFDLKRKFAEASVRAGDVTADLLEIYFGLLEQDPGNRSMYFQRISQIHNHLGNPDEAEKFKALAEKTG